MINKNGLYKMDPTKKKKFKMSMGSKEKNDPNNFSQKDQNIISKSTTGKMANGVVVSGDKSKINNKVNIPSAADKREAMIAKATERRNIIKAQVAERKYAADQKRKVGQDAIANRKLQMQRKKEGKDYVNIDGKVVRRKVKIVKK